MTGNTATAFVPKKNEPLIRQTMQAIADDLEAWNQAAYARDDEDGKRQFCFAGRALVLQGYTVRLDSFGWVRFIDTDGQCTSNATEEAAAELGLTLPQACDIFSWTPNPALDPTKEEQFQAFAEHVLAVTGIDCR